MSFFEELKRRNVFRVGIAYVLLGWVVLQAADFALDLIDAPNWIIQAMFIIGLTGLPIALFFAWAFELTPEGIKRESEVDRSQSVTPQTGRKLDRAIIVFLAASVVLLLGERFLFTGDPSAPAPARTSEMPAAATSETSPDAPAKSVAVLPFADMSRDQDQEWFADGLAEEILNALVRVPDLQVASRTSAFSYKGTSKDISQIAEELGVAHVLEGSVRSGGDRIRVTAQLIRAEDGFHVWSETYDRAPEDMIAIQEDLALSIAEALETTMDPQELAAMARVGTRSVEAYRAYLRAVAASFDGGTSGTEVLQALEHFQAATEADPRFAAAYLGEAAWWKAQLTPSYLGAGATELDVDTLMERFTVAIDQAIANADSPADRQGYLAQKAEVEVRLRDAIRLYEEYLESRPNDLDALFGLGTAAAMASNAGARDTALAKIRERGQRDPDAAIFYVSNAYESDPGAVADYGLERLAQWPDNRGLLYQVHRALAWAGRTEEAASIKRRHDLSYPESPLMAIREACMDGRREDAEAAMESIERGDDDRWRSTVWLALKMLGRDREATDVLRPIAASSASYQIASQLNYGIFDPSAFPELMNVLEREGVLRPPPLELPYKCPPPEGKSIAVLPFVNMSSDPEQEYFSDGISEEILNGLVKLEDLKVAGRTSSFSFKGKDQDLRLIGESLGVNHILEGSVRKAGDQVRITAQLVQVSDGFHLWSETYTRQLDDIFGVQDEISQAIVEALELTLSEEEAEQLVARSTDNVEAYNKYLQGRQLWHQRGQSNLQLSAETLQEAVTLDPEFALAWAALADAYVLIPEYTLGPHESNVWIPRARDAVNRALEIKPGMAQALTTRGYIRYQYDFDWENAEKDILQAINNEPTYATAHQWYGEMLAARDRDIEGGLASIQKGAELDPLAPIMWHVSGSLVGEMERFEEAVQYYERVLEISPNFIPTHNNLTWLYVRSGEYELAQDMWDRFLQLSGIEMPEDMPNLIDAAQDPVARQEFLEIMQASEGWESSTNNKANFYMFLGEPELALQDLIQAKAEGDPYAVTANRMAIFDPLRDDPRFIEHLESMNLKP